ncbi:MAG: TraM recognition domain-containing protein, partial [Desulfovibrio sp.]|nr:TraM recognition domain-containing protein [Desulfovibrio sp.]
YELLLGRSGSTVLGRILISLCFYAPAFWPLSLCIFFLLFIARKQATRFDHLPMRMPKRYPKRDYNAPAPNHSFKRAEGIFFLGNADRTNEELWISKDDILTHMLVLGTTGAGKTETLVSLAFNYFAVGSGFIYVDPKAAPRLGVQIWTMARILGREDDFLVISYMAEKEEEKRGDPHRRAGRKPRQSNTQNPFAVGDANSLTQLLFALMPSDENGQASIFSSNAQTLISGLLFVLVERRDMGLEPLSIETIRSYLMNIPKIDALARETQYSETASLALQAGLATVGWDKSKDLSHQPKSFPEQYGYARAYFGRALSLLVDSYGHIFRVSHGEVDARDVITNRRIFVTLIPSMDKDPKELKNLGQICLASVRNACAVGLGCALEGKVADVLGSLPTEAPVPFGVIVDEYAAIETPGFEILLTQGRGLGMACIVASQDFAGIKRASEAAAEQIVSNSKIKMFMTTEDPRQTADLVKNLAGQGYVLKSSGFSVDKKSQSHAYYDNCQVSCERMERVDFRDLQKQIEGDVTLSFKGEIIRARTFFANPPLSPEQHIRLNVFLQCHEPNADDLVAQFGRHKKLLTAFLARFARSEGNDTGEEKGHEHKTITVCSEDDLCALEDDWEGMECFEESSMLSQIGFCMREKWGSMNVSDLAISVVTCLGKEEGEERREKEDCSCFDLSWQDNEEEDKESAGREAEEDVLICQDREEGDQPFYEERRNASETERQEQTNGEKMKVPFSPLSLLSDTERDTASFDSLFEHVLERDLTTFLETIT